MIKVKVIFNNGLAIDFSNVKNVLVREASRTVDLESNNGVLITLSLFNIFYYTQIKETA